MRNRVEGLFYIHQNYASMFILVDVTYNCVHYPSKLPDSAVTRSKAELCFINYFIFIQEFNRQVNDQVPGYPFQFHRWNLLSFSEKNSKTIRIPKIEVV